MAGKHGGKRTGAGRPVATATLETQEQRKLLVEIIAPEIENIAKALIEKAKAGDVGAARELFDRAWGKVPQAIDHTTKGKELPKPILYGLHSDNDAQED